MKPSILPVLGVVLWTLTLGSPQLAAADLQPALRKAFAEADFQRKFDDWKRLGDDTIRLQRAREMFHQHAVSSAQVKRMAQGIANEDTRVEFVISAFPHTVDPENFYDVYDAFQTFSKVFRLHDRLERYRRPPGPNGPHGPHGPIVTSEPPPLGDAEFADLLGTVRAETFDNTRLSVARIAGTGARGRISSAQVCEVLALFSLDSQRLECAKLSVDWVRDPENLHLLYRKFTFENHKKELTRAIEARVRR